ncbi:sugar transferase [Sulfitobacter sp. JB4-11]|uniref:sugar transferase n=1 Tax=Sulfitobacter rhodophyticola TaxID=3238304 RepID=UPI003D8167CD
MSFESRWAEFSAGSSVLALESYELPEIVHGGPEHWSLKFKLFKALTDYGTALLALPVIALVSMVLLVLNPFLNRGPLMFVQTRMGRYGQPFRMLKFRTMTSADYETRAAHSEVEHHRITRLGRLLRKMRIDELPNFYNVLRGEMSLIGPRPDAYSHAEAFVEQLEGYKQRHRVKPGITGLAQVEMGYAEGLGATTVKAKYDNLYASKACGRLDVYILGRTVYVVLTGFGSK